MQKLEEGVENQIVGVKGLTQIRIRNWTYSNYKLYTLISIEISPYNFHSGTEKDLHDANVEYHNLNCAEAKSNAPPAPHPPPVSSPFTDTRIGWHLAYRDAYFRCPSPCYSPCPCQPGQQYYNPYYPAHVVNSAPVPAPVPAVPAPAPLPTPARAPIYYPYDPYATTYTVSKTSW